jgi:alpha-1,6-mannosyltransferase
MESAARRQQPIRLVVPAETGRVEDLSDYARIYYVAAKRAPLNPSYRVIYPPAFLYPRSAIQGILAAERPDLVEVCDKYNLNYLAGLLRVGLLSQLGFRPTVVGLSCERMDDSVASYIGGNAIGRHFAAWYMRRIYFPFFDHHIAISSRTAEELRQAGQGHPVRRGVWIRGMGVDLSTFSSGRRSLTARERLLGRLGKDPHCKLLVYIGRLAPEKNTQLLLQMMRHLRSEPEDICLLMVGDGIQRTSLEETSRTELPGLVKFFGYIKDRDALAEVLANCDLFIHPNPNEPFGIAPLEAMASGVPVVAPNSGGILEFANQSNAFLADALPEKFAEAVLTCVRDPQLRARKVGNAIRTAAAFDLRRVADSFLSLYEKIHAVTCGELPLDEADPLFSSQPPGSVGRGLTSTFATLGKEGFRTYIYLRTRLVERQLARSANKV